ncbi:MAG: hypothetical protein AB1Z98_08665 [Nannocystaceae bacterium]
MKLFHLDNIDVDARYCCVDVAVSCISELIEGTPALPVMEEDDEDVLDLQMDEDEGGLELGDYVPNPDGILPLRKACAEAIIAGFDVGEHELLPARLINEKERVHSDDYVVLNPLGEHDCLDRARSEMDGSTFDPTVQLMGKWCVSAKKVPALDLFRVECVEGYVLSERLVAFLESEGFTNFHFKPVTIC